MQIHWNEFRRDVRLSQYCGAEGKEKSITAACSPSPLPSSRARLRLRLFPSFLPSTLALCLLCLNLSTEKEFFELIFSRHRVIFPERVFTFSSARRLHPLRLSPSTPSLDPILPGTRAKNGRSQFPAINCRYSTHFAVTMPNEKLK